MPTLDMSKYKENLSKAYQPLLDDYLDKEFLILLGSSYSGKSWANAYRELISLLKYDNYQSVIFRRYKKSARESVYQQIIKLIQYYNLEKYFTYSISTNSVMRINCTIKGKENSYIQCMNYSSPDDVKSTANYTRIIFEEASEFERDEILGITQYLRGDAKYKGRKIPPQIVIILNPVYCWIKDVFCDNTYKSRRGVLLIQTNWADNEFLDGFQRDAMQTIYENRNNSDYDEWRYNVYYKGEWASAEGKAYFNVVNVDKQLKKLDDEFDSKYYNIHEVNMADKKQGIQENKKDYINNNYIALEVDASNLEIVKFPEKGHPYILGLDPRDELLNDEGDFTAGVMIDNITGETVALYHSNKDDADTTFKVVLNLLKFYNDAFLAPESNKGGYVVNALKLSGYGNISRTKRRDGIYMNKKNRPEIIQMVQKIFKDEIYKVRLKKLLIEASTFVVKNGKAQSAAGRHDDIIMAFGLATYSRDEFCKELIQYVDYTDYHKNDDFFDFTFNLDLELNDYSL